MIISRTPLRISLFGGGSDYPQYYNQYDGAVLATSIDKYCYVTLHNGKSWYTFDLPNKSGLASSSAYTVGLLRACTELDNSTISTLATTWEQDKMNGNVGSQDQYVCALGGFHLLKFSVHGIRDKVLSPDLVNPLQDYLMLFDTHQYRKANNIVAHQMENIKENYTLLSEMVVMVEEGYNCILKQDFLTIGRLLNATWKLKRQLSSDVSTTEIDAIYETALKGGAIGGKLLGGGGGGFMIIFAEPDKQEVIKSALADLTHVPFRFETQGSQVIFRSNERGL